MFKKPMLKLAFFLSLTAALGCASKGKLANRKDLLSQECQKAKRNTQDKEYGFRSTAALFVKIHAEKIAPSHNIEFYILNNSSLDNKLSPKRINDLLVNSLSEYTKAFEAERNKCPEDRVSDQCLKKAEQIRDTLQEMYNLLNKTCSLNGKLDKKLLSSHKDELERIFTDYLQQAEDWENLACAPVKALPSAQSIKETDWQSLDALVSYFRSVGATLSPSLQERYNKRPNKWDPSNIPLLPPWLKILPEIPEAPDIPVVPITPAL